MKILHISSNDIHGGAARAAYRLHRGLKDIDLESYMLVYSKTSTDQTVIKSSKTIFKRLFSKARQSLGLNMLPLIIYPKRDLVPYSVQWLSCSISQKNLAFEPDLINLHWICGECLSIKAIGRFCSPIIWTLHDMWPFTGGCHYDQGCGRYTQSCGACPQLHSQRELDLSHWTLWRKRRAWNKIDLTIVAISQWLAQCARQSALFQNLRIEIIPNGLDTEHFKPVDKHEAREILGLPQNKRLILFGAIDATTDSRKGFDLLKSALRYLSRIANQDEIDFVIMGSSQPYPSVEDLRFTPHYLGLLRDDISIKLVYAAADVFVAPSRQDNFPNTVLEALACGIPTVAFNIGGMPDMIDHHQNGYLAQPFQIEDLARGIQWILESNERRLLMSQNARQKVVRDFDNKLQARRYLELYEDILERRNYALSSLE